MTMKILSNRQWNAALDLINDKDEKIRELKREIQNRDELLKVRADKIYKLNAEISMLKRIIKVNGYSLAGSAIDFPNTQKGGFKDSNIFLL